MDFISRDCFSVYICTFFMKAECLHLALSPRTEECISCVYIIYNIKYIIYIYIYIYILYIYVIYIYILYVNISNSCKFTCLFTT